MNETVQDLADLNQLTGEDAAAAPTQAPAPKCEAVRDEFGRSYATGRRKESAARVWLKPGTGVVMINGRPIDQYFARPVLQMMLHFQELHQALELRENELLAHARKQMLAKVSSCCKPVASLLQVC